MIINDKNILSRVACMYLVADALNGAIFVVGP
jgi:hypothetical protein